MGVLSKITGCILAFSLLFLAYGQAEASTKTIREVSFYEPDYEVDEVADANYKNQIIAQHQVTKRIKNIDINSDVEPNLRGPALENRSGDKNVDFEKSYKEFQRHYSDEYSDID